MGNLRNELIESFKAGTLLQTIYDSAPANRDGRDALAAELARLHNESAIDLVTLFTSFRNRSDQGSDFFLTRRMFEKALPEIAASVGEVMRCVHHLHREAGRDLAAGTILESFVAFCAKDASRPEEALKEIEADPSLLDFLTPALVAGSRLEPEYYLDEAVRLAGDERPEVRKRAVFALGRLERMDGPDLRETAFAALERTIAQEDDDEILGSAVKSLSSLMRQDEASHERVIPLIDRALSKGGDYVRHAASDLFAFDTLKLPPALVDTLIAHLLHVNPDNTGTLENLDFGIGHLLEKGDQAKGLDFLEQLLVANAEALSMKPFDSAAAAILKDTGLRNRAVTRWLLRGDRVLCEAAHAMISGVGGCPIKLEADPNELKPADLPHIVFAAHKAIGYLFFKPISAVSFLISLMGLTPDDETLAALAEILFDPLLVNYTGEPLEYVRQRAAGESKRVAKSLNAAIGQVEKYLDDLRSVGTIRELHPGVAQREAHYRYQSRQFFQAYKEAEKQSVFLNILHKSVLLYGRKSITYVYGPDGKAHRTEIPLQAHSMEVEVPRGERIDPFGLDYMLRVFRAERWRT